MNREYANGIKNNILTKFFFYKLIACLTILIIAYAKAWGQVLKYKFFTQKPGKSLGSGLEI
jgi:hypothetical protein